MRAFRSIRAGCARFPWLEDVAVVLVAAAATIAAEWRIVTSPFVFQDDARSHEFWMRRFQDPELFRDPLTEALLTETGNVPPGIRGLYWLAARAVDPLAFGEWLPLVLVPLTAWLLFRVVRMHAAWFPAAWLGVGFFLFLWDVHRFSGGHARAFDQPLVLLTVFLLLRRQSLLAALVPPVAFLLYPPGALSALGVLAVSAFGLRGRLPWPEARRILALALAVLLVGGAVLVSRAVTGGTPEVISEQEARALPEFGPGGHWRFFVPEAGLYLRQNRSGFKLERSGAVLAVAALALLLVRPRNALLLRREVWALALASLALFALAHALLFRLYLPQRYTFPLVLFFAIALAVWLRPTWEAFVARVGEGPAGWAPLAVVAPVALAAAALVLFPLGPGLGAREFALWLGGATLFHLGVALAGAVGGIALFRPPPAAAAALVAGALLIGLLSAAGGLRYHGKTCRQGGLYPYLATLPKDAVIAGDPIQLNCVPVAAKRPVVITTKLYQPWHADYLAKSRERMSLMIRAYYGSSLTPLLEVRRRYGADYLVVQRRRTWRFWRHRAPHTGLVNELRDTVATPATDRLPVACRTWADERNSVYDLACVERTGRRG